MTPKRDRSTNRLNVKKISALPPGQYPDGGGLFVIKSEHGFVRWMLRMSYLGKPKQMGLGRYPEIGLASARELRDKWKAVARSGQDPVLVRKIEAAEARKALSRKLTTLEDVALDAFNTRKAELKGEANAVRWYGALKNHVLPKLGKRPIETIDQIDIRDTLSPIWHSKAEAARKAINRINIVMTHGAALGLDVDMNAVLKAKSLLGKQSQTPKNHPSMPWKDVPAYYQSLDEHSLVQIALKLLILNPGPRSKPLRFLRSEHIDGNIWNVPGELMKGAKGKTKDWRTPLSVESLRLIELTKQFERDGRLFPSVHGKAVISDASMSRHMERSGVAYRPHGFRHAFKTWTAETRQSFMISELCLAHAFAVNAQANYLLTDYLDERREMMDRWSSFLCAEQSET